MSHAWVAVTNLDEEGYWRLKVERELKKDQDRPIAQDDDDQ